jgi:hypothetical protein
MTEKSRKPYESREQNFKCVLFGFYDYHDIWHLLSSFALLLTSYRVILLSHPCKMCQFSYIRSMITGSRDIEIRVDVTTPTPQPSPQPMKRSDTLEDIPETDEREEEEEGKKEGEEKKEKEVEKGIAIEDAIFKSHALLMPTGIGPEMLFIENIKNENCDRIAPPIDKEEIKVPLGLDLLMPPAISPHLMLPENRHLKIDFKLDHLASSEDISELETGCHTPTENQVYGDILSPNTVTDDDMRFNDISVSQTSVATLTNPTMTSATNSTPTVTNGSLTVSSSDLTAMTKLEEKAPPNFLEVPNQSGKLMKERKKKMKEKSAANPHLTAGSKDPCYPVLTRPTPTKFYILRP